MKNKGGISMVDTTILSKLSLIYSFLLDNSLIFLILLLLIVIVLDLFYGKNSKSTKNLYCIIISLILIYIGIIYHKPLLNIFDTYITHIFKLTYFPSIIEYISFILVTIILQIYSIKRNVGFIKHMNLWVGLIIEGLFIINVIAMNNIKVDLNSLTSIYENDLLLSIFQVTGIIFMLWIAINILVFIINLYLDKRIEMPKLDKYYE